MNGLRIGIVGILVDRWGNQMAEGALHFLEGWVIFLACAALLGGEMFALAYLSGRRFFDVFHAPVFKARPAKEAPVILSESSRLWHASPCCALAASLFSIFPAGRKSFRNVPASWRFPTRLAQWQGQPSSLDLDTEQALKADDYLLANYSQSDGKVVNFYVSYYASQRKNKSPHSPIVCLPGGGWLITRLDRRNFNGAGAQIISSIA